MIRDMTDAERDLIASLVEGERRGWMPLGTAIAIVVLGLTTIALFVAGCETGSALVVLACMGLAITLSLVGKLWRGWARRSCSIGLRRDLAERKVEIVEWRGERVVELVTGDSNEPAFLVENGARTTLLVRGSYLAGTAFPSTSFAITRAMRSRLALLIELRGDALEPQGAYNVATLRDHPDGERFEMPIEGALDRLNVIR